MMFKKIRNKILLLNMVMVSSVVVIAFALIFASTYSRIQSENLEKLTYDLPLRQTLISGAVIRQAGAIRVEPATNGTVISGYTKSISPVAGMSFSIVADSQNNVIEVDSLMDLRTESYKTMAAHALESAGGENTITLEGRTWQYMVSPISATLIDASGESSVSITAAEAVNYIRFLDVTDSYRMIRALLFLMSGSTLVILAVFFFISRYFATQAIRPMEEAWEKQSRFIADASHELKTPLSVISANCGVLYAGREETVGSQLKWVDSIMRAADRMAGLTGSLLSLANMEDAQLEIYKTPFELSGEISQAADEAEAPAIEKKLKVSREIAADIEIVNDRGHVRRVLSILLDNAVKYTETGGEVTVSLAREKRRVICTVRNSGAGVPAEELPRLFDRFYRADPARSSENGGYGLGLSIASAIVNQIGAKISADSVVGEYTEFKLIFEESSEQGEEADSPA